MTEENLYFAGKPEDLDNVAVKLLSAYPFVRIFAFFGNMGVGKTTFIQSIVRKLGVDETASSPSYSIVNHYMTSKGDSVYHFDFYRINRLEEVYDLGYEHYFFSGNYCFIEWPEKLEALLPDNSVRVTMTLDGERRVIRF